MSDKIVESVLLDDHKIRLKFNDGTSSEADLSYLAGQGAFALWGDRENFKQAPGAGSGPLAWAGEMDIDADSFYMKLTGAKTKTSEFACPCIGVKNSEVFCMIRPRSVPEHARKVPEHR